MGLLCSADVRAGEAVGMMVVVVVVGCIYLPGNNASLLGGIVSCKERRGQFVCDCRVSLVRERFVFFVFLLQAALPWSCLTAVIQQVTRSPQSTAQSVWLAIHYTDAPCLPLPQTCASSRSE